MLSLSAPLPTSPRQTSSERLIDSQTPRKFPSKDPRIGNSIISTPNTYSPAFYTHFIMATVDTTGWLLYTANTCLLANSSKPLLRLSNLRLLQPRISSPSPKSPVLYSSNNLPVSSKHIEAFLLQTHTSPSQSPPSSP